MSNGNNADPWPLDDGGTDQFDIYNNVDDQWQFTMPESTQLATNASAGGTGGGEGGASSKESYATNEVQGGDASVGPSWEYESQQQKSATRQGSGGGDSSSHHTPRTSGGNRAA
ncbi:hypothetical protein EV182_004764, partial [Spiromyces aspiralis]